MLTKPEFESQPFDPSIFNTPNQWVVYGHFLTGEANPVWIGYCRLADVLLAPDAHETASWRALVLDRAGGIRLTLFARHDTALAAMRECGSMVRRFKPPANASAALRTPGAYRQVRCVNTGMVYNSAAEACRANGLQQAQMSIHLNNRNSSQIKGLRFEWC